MGKLDGKAAIVTGASRGIGMAIARLFAAAGAVNISEEEDCRRLIQAAKEAYGPCDVLVNNAALNYSYPVADYPANRWKRSFAVNVFAPVMLSQVVLPDMMA